MYVTFLPYRFRTIHCSSAYFINIGCLKIPIPLLILMPVGLKLPPQCGGFFLMVPSNSQQEKQTLLRVECCISGQKMCRDLNYRWYSTLEPVWIFRPAWNRVAASHFETNAGTLLGSLSAIISSDNCSSHSPHLYCFGCLRIVFLKYPRCSFFRLKLPQKGQYIFETMLLTGTLGMIFCCGEIISHALWSIFSLHVV